MNEKVGGGGHLQPYIPKGNGDASGEYCAKNVDERSMFDVQELTHEETMLLRHYTDSRCAIELNAALRQKTQNSQQERIARAIEGSVRKSVLKVPIVVYRGIVVSRGIYKSNFSGAYLRKETKTGSRLCSTSLKVSRALDSLSNLMEGQVGVIFRIELPTGYNALDMTPFALDPDECEILLASPVYKIASLQEYHRGNNVVCLANLKIER